MEHNANFTWIFKIKQKQETSKNDCAGSSPLGLQVPLPLGAGRGVHLCCGGEVFAEKMLASLSLVGKSVVPGQCLSSVNVMVHDSVYKRINILCPLQTYLYLTYKLEALGILWRFPNSLFFQNAFLALKAFIKLVHQRFTVFSCVFFKMYKYFKFPASSISCLGRYTVTDRFPAFRNAFT